MKIKRFFLKKCIVVLPHLFFNETRKLTHVIIAASYFAVNSPFNRKHGMGYRIFFKKNMHFFNASNIFVYWVFFHGNCLVAFYLKA